MLYIQFVFGCVMERTRNNFTCYTEYFREGHFLILLNFCNILAVHNL